MCEWCWCKTLTPHLKWTLSDSQLGNSGNLKQTPQFGSNPKAKHQWSIYYFLKHDVWLKSFWQCLNVFRFVWNRDTNLRSSWVSALLHCDLFCSEPGSCFVWFTPAPSATSASDLNSILWWHTTITLVPHPNWEFTLKGCVDATEASLWYWY